MSARGAIWSLCVLLVIGMAGVPAARAQYQGSPVPLDFEVGQEVFQVTDIKWIDWSDPFAPFHNTAEGVVEMNSLAPPFVLAVENWWAPDRYKRWILEVEVLQQPEEQGLIDADVGYADIPSVQGPPLDNQPPLPLIIVGADNNVDGDRWIVGGPGGPAVYRARGGWVHYNPTFVCLHLAAPEGTVLFYRFEDWCLCPGDIVIDNHVNVLDLMALVNAWGSVEGDVHYNWFADLNLDGSVNVLDLMILVNNWGRDCWGNGPEAESCDCD